jgi:hypothetical protein
VALEASELVKSETMSNVRRLDAVSIFEGKLNFLIPHEWIEVESGENGDYLYQMSDSVSGWFRVSLITANNVVSPTERLRKSLGEHGGLEVNERTGNLIARSEKDSIEDGTQLYTYNWFIGGCVSSSLIREAVFSYTVLADLVNDNETQSEVKLLGQLVTEAYFDRTG